MAQNIDRSLAFTALLELSPEFGRMAPEDSLPLVGELVAAWDRDQPKDRWAHAKAWIAAREA